MLHWDDEKKTKRGKGTHGTFLAFSAADEEQGRKTFHCHWQMWVEEINQTLQIFIFMKTLL
jgi:hypothetical protein